MLEAGRARSAGLLRRISHVRQWRGRVTRRALQSVRTPAEDVAQRVSTGYGGEWPVAGVVRGWGQSLVQPELGVFLVTCGAADLRLSPEGVLAYTIDGMRLIPPDPWRGVAGRGAVLDELFLCSDGGTASGPRRALGQSYYGSLSSHVGVGARAAQSIPVTPDPNA